MFILRKNSTLLFLFNKISDGRSKVLTSTVADIYDVFKNKNRLRVNGSFGSLGWIQ